MSMREKMGAAAQSERDVTLYLSDISRGFRKFWWLSVLLAVLSGGFMYGWSKAHFVPMYQTTAVYTVLTQNDTLSGGENASAYSFTYSRTTAERLAYAFGYAAGSSILQKKICEELDVSQMPAAISVEFAEGTNLMTVTATGADPQLVYEIQLAFARNYSDVTMYITGPTKLVTISEPVLPTQPSNGQDWKKSTLRASELALALGLAWIGLYALLRQTVRTKEDIRQELNQTCIGVLPRVTFKRHKQKMDERILITNPAISEDFLESVRILQDAVQNGLSGDKKVVLVTSTAPGEGKSVVTLNLATMLAKNGKNVLVMDADLRKTGISALLPPNRTGGDGRRKRMYRIENYPPLGIDMLTFDTRSYHPRQIMRTEQMKKIVDALREKYDLILIDTPPCGMISDTGIVAGAADGAVYVVRQDTVLSSRIRNGINTLLATDIPLLGCVLNGTTSGIGSYGYYYGYGGYRHGYRRSAEK